MNWLKILLNPTQPVPSVSLIFLSTALVALLQIPINWLLRFFNVPVAILINEVLLLAGGTLLLSKLLRYDLRRLFPLARPSLVSWLLLIIGILGAVIVIDYLTSFSRHFFPGPPSHQIFLDQLMAVDSSAAFIGKLFLLCFIPGICEEVFFRGFCQTTLTQHYGNFRAILITAALFAILHGNPWQIHLYFLLGFLLSFSYAVSKTLLVPITFHILNNMWTFTNHLQGVHFPLIRANHPLDLLVLTSGAVLAGSAGYLFWRENSKGHL